MILGQMEHGMVQVDNAGTGDDNIVQAIDLNSYQSGVGYGHRNAGEQASNTAYAVGTQAGGVLMLKRWRRGGKIEKGKSQCSAK